MSYKLIINKQYSYDNQGAYKQLLAMMKHGDKLNMKCYTDKNGFAYVWVESRNISAFKYIIRKETFKAIIHYLKTGKYKDFDQNPMQNTKQIEGFDFQKCVLDYFIRLKHTIQYGPLFREYNNTIRGNIPMFKGTIFFNIPRTEKNINYLRENHQID